MLATVGLAVRSSIRKTDLAVRWGGEEILVMLPGADRTRTAAQAQRLLAAVRALRMTVSIGVWGDETLIPLNEAIESSDAALYHAKVAGRDRYRVVVPMKSPLRAETLEA